MSSPLGSLHRKMLHKSNEVVVDFKKPCISYQPFHDSCITPPPPPPPPLPPPPPPPPASFNQSLSPFLIIMFGGLAVSFCFICYLTCATRYRTWRTNNQLAHEDVVNEDLGPVAYNPIWLISTRGLDPSQIESIQIFKYKRDEKVIEGTDCSVCLSEFEDDESLRLLPKCSHAFHVPCIDTWLQSHTNCPLCRAPIVKNTNSNDQIEHAITESNSSESSSLSEETEREARVNDSETIDDHRVVEVENNGEVVKTFGVVDERSSRVRVRSDLVDPDRVRGEGLAAMRRSFSNSQLVGLKKLNSVTKRENKLNESSSSIHLYCKVMKSASSGRSLKKASSFTSKCRPHDQSY